MGMLTSWRYPLEGILYISSSPSLMKVILKFLFVVFVSSIFTIAAFFHLFYDWHLRSVAKVFGFNVFSKLVASVAILAEAGLPMFIIFEHRFDKLQLQLFDATLKVKGVSVEQLAPPDRETLHSMLTKSRSKLQASRSASSLPFTLATAVFTFAWRLLIKPQPKEAKLVRKLRDLTTLGASLFLPMLLPLFAYRDSYAEAAALLSRYWDMKGVTDPDAQEIVVQQRMGDYRSFGLVAALLNYIPVLNWFLGLTNMVGAALYAADQECKQTALFKRRL